MSAKRKYEQKVRAEHQEETRRRIAAATAELHQELGPAKTTIKAIAERAGVERLTVYRHFPEERELLQACNDHFLTLHPPPDPTPWLVIADPQQRLRAALTTIYARHRDTEAMTANVLRDLPAMPALADLMSEVPKFYAYIQAVLAIGWPAPPDRQPLLHAAIGHALDFETWRSLARRQSLTDEQAIEVMITLVRSLAVSQPG
jgi:AcrR family transcriptional regulator